MNPIKTNVIERLAALLEMEPGQVDSMLETPPSPDLGDWAFPCFTLAKKLRKAPPAIAADLSAQLADLEGVKEVRAAGGYLNFFASVPALAEFTLSQVLQQGDEYGQSTRGQGQTVVIDFSSPNIAKPFGMGHVRSTVIGAALSRLYAHLGFKVVRINHLGDWGTQFGKVICAYLKWGDDKELEERPVKTLYDLYVKFHAEAETNPVLEDEARAWFKRLEDGDPEAHKLWERFRELSLKEFKATFERLGVEFDSWAGEAFYQDRLAATIEQIEKAGISAISEGAMIVPFDELNLPPALLRKSDGATLYATRDVAAAFYRLETYCPDYMIYVVGGEQILHFKQLFAVLRKLGYPENVKLEHVAFGLIRLPEGKMSTRKGQMVLLDDVINRSTELVRQIIADRNPELPDINQVAEQVGIGAIVFSDLKHNRMREEVFTWEDILNFDGETGPYVQYTYARAQSVLRKGRVSADVRAASLSPLDEPYAAALIKQMGAFEEILVQAASANEPSTLARFTLDLAQMFNKFYHECRIIGQDPEVEQARLQLTAAVASVLHTALGILGVATPEQM
jgi:arginyl-tRNA synthetase